jgi:hypothetical protein
MQDDFLKLATIVVKKCFKHFNLSQQKNLADLMTAYLSNTSFTMWDISTSLSGNTTTKHKHKRLIYFLDSLTIDLNFWKSYSLAIFSLPGFKFKKRKMITLALDATSLKDDFWILAVTISFNGRGIPLYLKCWKGVNENYDYWSRVKSVLKDLKAIMPKGYLFEIVADRGFQGDVMFKMCKELGIDFIVRINDSYKIKLPNGQEYLQLSLFNDGYYITESLGKKSQTPDMNLCVNSKELENGEVAKWYLAANRRELSQEIMTERYTTRFWIEEGIKDLKSKLHWEKYTEKIPQKERLTKCVIVSCLSYAVQTAIGNQMEMSASERMRTSVFNKFRQSIRRGTDELQRIILNFINIITTYIMRAALCFD